MATQVSAPARGWVAHRPGGRSVVTCVQDPKTGGISLLIKEIQEDKTTTASTSSIIRTFPELPQEAVDGQAVFNKNGSLLAIWCSIGVLLVSFPDTFGNLQQLGDDMETNQLRLEEASSERVTLTWVGSMDACPVKGIRDWGMSGTIAGNVFEGCFTGQLKGLFKLQHNPSNTDTEIQEWRGSCVLTEGQTNEGDWPLRLVLNKKTKNASVGRVSVTYVDPTCLFKIGAADVCWHPLSVDHLCVLSVHSQLRIYHCSRSLALPESTLDLALPNSKHAIRTSFMENNIASKGESLWTSLTCFVLYADGMISAVSPVGNPAKLQVPETVLLEARDQLSSTFNANDPRDLQKLNFFKVACAKVTDPTVVDVLLGVPTPQIICPASGTPLERYANTVNDPSRAVDFSITKVRSNRNEAIIHRTWSSGHLDVILWRDCKMEPWWVSFNKVFHPPRAAVTDFPSTTALASPSKHGFRISDKVQRSTGFGARINAPPELPMIEPRTIRCVEVWHSGEQVQPCIYPTLAHPLVFICLDLRSGLGVVFKDTWAEQLSSSDGEVRIDVVPLPSLRKVQGRNACSVFCDSRSSPGIVCVDGVSLLALSLFDPLRQLNNSSSLAIQRLTAETTLASRLDQTGAQEFQAAAKAAINDSKLHMEDLNRMRGMLNAFSNAIPVEIAGIVVDQQPANNETTGIVLEWLNTYYTRLMHGEGQTKGMVAILSDAHDRLERAKLAQRETVNNMISMLKAWDNERGSTKHEREIMSEQFSNFHEVSDIIRQSAQLVHTRAVNLRPHRDPSPEELKLRQALEQLRVHASRLSDTCEEARSQAKERIRRAELQRLSEEDEGRNTNNNKRKEEESRPDVAFENKVLEAKRMIEDIERRIDSLKVSLKRLNALPSVLLVSAMRNIDPAVNAKWTELQKASRPFRVLVHNRLLTRLMQGLYRYQEAALELPLQVSRSGTLMEVIYIPRQATISVVNDGDFRITVPEFGEARIDGFTEVLPMLFNGEGSRQPVDSFLDYIIAMTVSPGSVGEEWIRVFEKSFKTERLVSCFQAGQRRVVDIQE